MPTGNEVTVRSSLEQYLKREGLLALIPAYRRNRLFRLRTGIPWMVILVMTSFASLVWTEGAVGALAGTILVLVLVAGLVATGAMAYGLRTGHNGLPRGVDLYLIVFAPASLALYIGATLHSFLVSVAAGVGFYVLFDALLAVQDHGFRIYMMWSQLRLGARMIIRSAKMATILLPLLLVFVLFSLFSEEIWIVLSSLEPDQAVGALVLLVIPAGVYIWASIRILVQELTKEIDKETMREQLMSIPAVAENSEDGLISPEELDEAHRQVAWRDLKSLTQATAPAIRHRLRLQLYLLAGCMGVVLSICFAVYFFALFYTLIPDAVAAEWTGKSATRVVHTVTGFQELPFLQGTRPLQIIQVHMAEVKVAAALGVLLSILANVYALAEEPVQKSLRLWLTPQVQQWQTAGVYYRSLLAHDLHIVGEPYFSPDRAFARVMAEVPGTLENDGVEAACLALREELREYDRVEIRACRSSSPEAREAPAFSGETWILIDDPAARALRFAHIPASASPVRKEHFLGQQCLKTGEAVPAEWFGDTPLAVQIGKAVWDADRIRPQPIVLHPYVTHTDREMRIEVRLIKRLARTRDYRQVFDSILESLEAGLGEIEEVEVTLLYRDQPRQICSLIWNRPLGFRHYVGGAGGVRLLGPDAWTGLFRYFSHN